MLTKFMLLDQSSVRENISYPQNTDVCIKNKRQR